MSEDIRQKDLIINQMTMAEYHTITPKTDELYDLTDEPVLDLNEKQFQIDDITHKISCHTSLDEELSLSMRGDGLWGIPERIYPYDETDFQVALKTGEDSERRTTRNTPFATIQFTANVLCRNFNFEKDINFHVIEQDETKTPFLVVPQMQQNKGFLVWDNPNNFEFTCPSQADKPMIEVLKNGRLKLKNVVLNFPATKAPNCLIRNYGELVLENCTINHPEGASNIVESLIENHDGKVTVQNCTFNFLETSHDVRFFDYCIKSEGGEVTFRLNTMHFAYPKLQYTDMNVISFIYCDHSICRYERNDLNTTSTTYISNLIAGLNNSIIFFKNENSWDSTGFQPPEEVALRPCIRNLFYLYCSKCVWQGSAVFNIHNGKGDRSGNLKEIAEIINGSFMTEENQGGIWGDWSKTEAGIFTCNAKFMLSKMDKLKFLNHPDEFKYSADASSELYDQNGKIN